MREPLVGWTDDPVSIDVVKTAVVFVVLIQWRDETAPPTAMSRWNHTRRYANVRMTMLRLCFILAKNM